MVKRKFNVWSYLCSKLVQFNYFMLENNKDSENLYVKACDWVLDRLVEGLLVWFSVYGIFNWSPFYLKIPAIGIGLWCIKNFVYEIILLIKKAVRGG